MATVTTLVIRALRLPELTCLPLLPIRLIFCINPFVRLGRWEMFELTMVIAIFALADEV